MAVDADVTGDYILSKLAELEPHRVLGLIPPAIFAAAVKEALRQLDEVDVANALAPESPTETPTHSTVNHAFVSTPELRTQRLQVANNIELAPVTVDNLGATVEAIRNRLIDAGLAVPPES